MVNQLKIFEMKVFTEKHGDCHNLICILERSLSLSMENRSEEAEILLSGWLAFFFLTQFEECV